MSAVDDETPQPPRAGTYADLARRMDRMENKYDSLEGEVRTQGIAIQRVEANQKHSSELNELHFTGIKDNLKSIDDRFSVFMTRIEGIISGEVQTQATRAGAEMVADYQRWRITVDSDLDTLRNQNVRQSGINTGIGQTFGTGKAIVITSAAVVTAVVTVLGALHII